MKNALLLVILTILCYGCTKTSSTSTVVTPSGAENHWIPNWWGNDTLYISSTPTPTFGDTIFTKTIGDTSCIIYKNVKYYVWTVTNVTTITGTIYSYSANAAQYQNCCLSTVPFDTTVAFDFTFGNGMRPYKYYDTMHSAWVHQPQVVWTSKTAFYTTLKEH